MFHNSTIFLSVKDFESLYTAYTYKFLHFEMYFCLEMYKEFLLRIDGKIIRIENVWSLAWSSLVCMCGEISRQENRSTDVKL